MRNGFPNGRSFTASEIRVESRPQEKVFSLVWERQGFARELPRLFWGSFAVLFILLGVFAIDEVVAMLIFVLMGFTGLVALSSSVEILIHNYDRLERRFTLGPLCLGVEIKPISESSFFDVRKTKTLDGNWYYLVVVIGESIEEILPVESWDDYSGICRQINEAFHDRPVQKVDRID